MAGAEVRPLLWPIVSTCHPRQIESGTGRGEDEEEEGQEGVGQGV